MIKILGHSYEVIDSPTLMEERGSSGTCCPNTLQIKISSHAPLSIREESLLHEIFEAIRYHLNLTDDVSHQAMSSMSEALFAVMKDNPQYFKMSVHPPIYPPGHGYQGGDRK